MAQIGETGDVWVVEPESIALPDEAQPEVVPVAEPVAPTRQVDPSGLHGVDS